MAKRLQHRGGTTSQHSTFTGAVREVTVDTDKNTLVVHDGATAGGHPLATTTNFTSTGIDDNATSTAITIDSSQNVTVDGNVVIQKATGDVSLTIQANENLSSREPSLNLIGYNTSSNPTINFGDNAGYAGAIEYENSDNSMRLYTATSESMRITSAGNVGIGTSSPSTKLDVNGGGAFSDDVSIAKTSALTKLSITASGVANFDLGFNNSGATSQGISNNAGFLSTRQAYPIIFATSEAERMRIDSSGRVGIGTTNPIGLVNIVQASNTQALLRLRNNTADTSAADGMIFTITDSSSPVGSIEMISGGSDAKLAFRTNGAEAMRIESNGNVAIGKVHTDANTVSGIKFFKGGQQYLYAGAPTDIMRFYDSGTGTEVGDIVITSSTTSYNTSSDYRLKENVSYDFDATTRLKQLKPARFNFIADANTTVDGFLAHEVQDIVPEAITGTKDAVQVWQEGDELPEGVSVGDNKLDENGNTIPEYQGIDQSKLVPLLVKTIQELEARITALETQP